MKKQIVNKKTVIPAVIIFVLVLTAELLFANRYSFYTKIGIVPEDAVTVTGSATYKDGKIISHGSAVAEFTTPDTEIDYICLDTTGGACIAEVIVSIMDENSSTKYQKCATYDIYADGEVILPVDSMGNAHSVKLQFSDLTATVNAIYINQTNTFKFNFVRFALVYLFAIIVFLTIRHRLWSIDFNPASSVHRSVICIVLCVSTAFVIIGSVKSTDFVDYEIGDDVTDMTCYEQQLDAVLKGRLDLDIEFDKEGYANLENPYDPGARRAAVGNAGALWDKAYYEGKVYSYFGIAPVLLFYLPVYLISGKMPGDGFISALVAIAALFAMLSALFAMLRYFRIKPKLIMLALAIPTLFSASLIYILNAHPSMYYIAVMCGVLFLSLLITFSLKAVSTKSKMCRRIYLALAGLSAVAIAASRPNELIFVIMLIPCYIDFFFKQKRPIKEKIIDFAFPAVPVVIGASLLMYYNYARFGSPLEFGSSYQITVANMSEKTITLSALLPSIFHYFITPISFTGNFPFINTSAPNLGTYVNYTYIYGSAGVLNFPVTWFGAMSLGSSKGNRVKRFTYLGAILAAFAVAFADFSLAGIHLRYMGDIMFPLALIGIVIMLELTSDTESKYASTVRHIAIILSVITLLVSTALLFNNEADNIKNLTPDVYNFFKNLFE